MELEDYEGRQYSAEKVGKGVDNTSNEKKYVGVEALIGVCRMGIPGRF